MMETIDGKHIVVTYMKDFYCYFLLYLSIRIRFLITGVDILP